MMLDYMTHQVLVYQSCQGNEMENILKKLLMDELSLYVYAYPGRRHSLNEEDWSDFLLGFHDKMQDILINFHFQGPSFWGYLNKVLEWQLLSFYRQTTRFRQVEWVCERESKIEYEWVSEKKECCLHMKIRHLLDYAGLTAFRVDALKQRLLILVLKNIVFFSEEDYLSVFPLLGPSTDKGATYRDQLLSVMRPKFERKERLELKRCENYSKLTLTEKKCSEEIYPGNKRALTDKMILYRNRMRTLDRQIKRIPMYPSNEEISNIIDVPKGSVDSGLFYLRNYLKSEYLKAAYFEGEKMKELLSPGLGCPKPLNQVRPEG